MCCRGSLWAELTVTPTMPYDSAAAAAVTDGDDADADDGDRS